MGGEWGEGDDGFSDMGKAISNPRACVCVRECLCIDREDNHVPLSGIPLSTLRAHRSIKNRTVLALSLFTASPNAVRTRSLVGSKEEKCSRQAPRNARQAWPARAMSCSSRL